MAEQAKQTPTAQVMPQRMGLSEQKTHHWTVDLEPGVTQPQLLQPEFWGLVAVHFQPFDHVEVRADDGSFWGEYLVTECARTWAKMRELRFVRLQETTTAISEQQSVRQHRSVYRGGHLKWCVERLSDDKRLIDSLGSKKAADDWIDQHEKTVGRAQPA